MSKRIPDEELTPEQLAKREKRRRYLAANRERIKAQRHDYYLRNAEKIRARVRLKMRAMSTEERRIKDKKYQEKHNNCKLIFFCTRISKIIKLTISTK